MSDGASCQPRMLAKEGSVRVELCGCGQVHVSLGSITVRLGRAQYLILCDTLLAGARRLQQIAASVVH
jgi:hypothetical protein